MKKQNLTVTIFMSISILSAALLLITGTLWITSVQDRFKEEVSLIRLNELKKAKAEIKESVDALVQFIEYRQKITEQVIKEELKERVSNADSIINGIYQENKDKLSEQDIKAIIIETLRDIRFNGGRGYYFIDSLEGDVVLYPTIPESEGKNLLFLQDGHGSYALQQEIDLINRKGAGYIEGYWEKPGQAGENFKKITYVQGFEPYNWYFGTGEYVDNVTVQIQNEIKQYVNQLRYGASASQYIFIHDDKGIELANGLFPELIGINSIELQDINGVKVIQEQIAITESSNHGGFLTHYWSNSEGNGDIEKLTYVTAIQDWNWIIGSGIDMAFLDKLVADKQFELAAVVKDNVYKIIILLFLAFLLSLVIAKLAVSSINKNISLFVNHIEQSSRNLKMIDLEQVEYNDFIKLALVSNQMTQRINNLLYKDELTGLFNRRYINEKLAFAIVEAVINKKDISIIMLDIDNFKHINDAYGHQAGDQVLVEVSKVIQDTIRNTDYVGRYGGEEIIVILPESSNAIAIQVAESIRMNIERYIFVHINKAITISGGVFTSREMDVEDLIKNADNNLYKAKHNGRNQIVY